MAHEKILVVDDSPSILDLLSDMLGVAGYEVDTASDGIEGFDIAVRKSFDLVITDINMPRCNGIELLNRLNKNFENLAVIIITGYANLDSAREAMVGGAADYIFKPFKNSDLLASVQRTLNYNRVSKENTRLRETLALFDVSEAIASSTRRESLYEIIVVSALTQIHAGRGAIVVAEDGEFRLKSAVDFHQPVVLEGWDWEQYPVTHMLMEERKPVLVTATTNYLLPEEITQIEYSPGTYPEIFPFEKETIFFPLQSQGQLFGFLMFSKSADEPAFSHSDIQLISIISNQSAIAAYNSQLVRNLEMSYLNTLMSLNLILEAKHPYTQGHSRRVVNLCMMIGRKMGLNSTEMEALKDGAMLHDLGKIGVSDLILNKKSDLTEEEVNIIRRHPIIGEEIIKPITFLAPARSIIRHHHEWINGMGWPDGLAGDEISLKVAVCSVADAIDAMSSDRIYRRPLTLDKIKHELTRNAGTQFHPDVINAALDFITPDILEQIDNTTS